MASYSGLWNNEYGENYSQLNRSQRIGNKHTGLARVFAQRLYSSAALGTIIKSLVAGNVGDVATSQHKRVQARSDVNMNIQGGPVPVETFNDINRATTANDQSDVVRALTLDPKPTYPVDKAGAGGGSKLGW